MNEPIYLFIANGSEEVEALTIVDVLRRAGMDIKTVSITGTDTISSAHQVKIVCDLTFEQADFADAAMLVLPGGVQPGALSLDAHEGVRAALTKQFEAGKPLAAICAAPLVFGHLGILKGKKATCYPGFEKELTGATYTAALVEQDGNIITGKGPAAAMPFAFAIVEFFLGKEAAEKVKTGMLYPELVR